MKFLHVFSALAATLTLIAVSSAASNLTRTTDRNWLSGADEKTRYERLEHYLGGFSSAMQDTGLRFGHVKQALNDQNWPLGQYHWGKISGAIENGLMKRPARRANAETIFLDKAWDALNEALKNEDAKDIKETFMAAHQACVDCHVAEQVAFMNNQPLLR
jgi:hypothetical protein